jgi:pimeloyl-ACP methyl ester carboxylesterase
MNIPVPLVRDWFESVEAPQGKRMEVFEGSGHGPFLTEAERFVETVRGFGAEVAGKADR